MICARSFWLSKNDSCLEKQFKMAKLILKHHVLKMKTYVFFYLKYIIYVGGVDFENILLNTEIRSIQDS